MKRFILCLVILCLSLSLFASKDWSGDYYWTNSTDKDNKGKCKALHFKVVPASGPYYEIYTVIEGVDYRIFPIVGFGQDEGLSYSWDSPTPQGLSYRINAGVFNTTSFRPDSWTVKEIEVDKDRYTVVVETRVAIFKINTFTTFRFVMKDNKRCLLYSLGGDGIAKTGLFKNPNPDAVDKLTFTLEER